MSQSHGCQPARALDSSTDLKQTPTLFVCHVLVATSRHVTFLSAGANCPVTILSYLSVVNAITRDRYGEGHLERHGDRRIR